MKVRETEKPSVLNLVLQAQGLASAFKELEESTLCELTPSSSVGAMPGQHACCSACGMIIPSGCQPTRLHVFCICIYAATRYSSLTCYSTHSIDDVPGLAPACENCTTLFTLSFFQLLFAFFETCLRLLSKSYRLFFFLTLLLLVLKNQPDELYKYSHLGYSV